MAVTKQTREQLQAASRKGNLARQARYQNVPMMLRDMRRVWKAGLPDGDAARDALRKRLSPAQRVLYRLLEEKPGDFLKKLEEAEDAFRAKAEEKAGMTNGGGGTIAAEARHGKVEDLLGKLMGEFMGAEA